MDREAIRQWIEEDAAALPSLAEGRVPDAPALADSPPPKTNLSPTVTLEGARTAEASNGEQSGPQDENTSEARADARAEEAGSPRATGLTAQPEEERRDRLVADLAATLRAEADRAELPLREYTALAALEMLRPGVASDPASIPSLTPREVELLGAWRDLFRRADVELRRADGGLGALTTAVGELAQRMSEWETLQITSAELCTKVEGFGQYTPLPHGRMLAGRRNRVIVYVEVDHFTHQASSGEAGEPGYLVELSQELSLYHDADGLLAWRQPRQRIRDFSRNQRRDFFVVQLIDLPETLTVGKYRLKVTMRDEATGAVAEEILPIEVVGDAALVRAGS